MKCTLIFLYTITSRILFKKLKVMANIKNFIGIIMHIKNMSQIKEKKILTIFYIRSIFLE